MLSKFIQQLRKQKNLTQEFLAMEIGISRPTYIQIEKGKRDLTVTEAKKIAAIFNLSLDDFLSGNLSKREVVLEKESAEQKADADIQIRVTQKNLDKFKQVLLYILFKVGGQPNIGESVLHKLLYFIDFDYYEKFKENLIGATYIKSYHGPLPVEFEIIIKDMQESGEIEAVNSRYFKYEQKKYLPLKRPNLNNLSAREINHIDNVLARLADKNIKEIENYSREDAPWKTAEEGQTLSYESVLGRDKYYSVRSREGEL